MFDFIHSSTYVVNIYSSLLTRHNTKYLSAKRAKKTYVEIITKLSFKDVT